MTFLYHTAWLSRYFLYSLGFRGGESGLGGTYIGFGNGFGFGKPRGGSGVMVFLSEYDPAANVAVCRMNLAFGL